MSSQSNNNTRIAKNTVLLYIRMIFLLCISFYTSRAILKALGVIDLGIYNVVGGVVAMFGFLNGSLSSASSRFLTYSLGRGDIADTKDTFNTIVTVHTIFAFMLLVILESIGLWFVFNELVIPHERFFAAFWVFQSTIITSVTVVITAPFNADIIAHERMSAFAYISIYEAIAKLLIIFVLFKANQDRLIIYAVLLMIVQSSVALLYVIFCRKNFPESRFRYRWDNERIKIIFSYAGWVMTGSFAYICCTQGLNIILNLFFGPAVNAARALANQFQGALNQFTTNFQTAVRPQITKNYANGNLDRMHSLVLKSSKLGSFLMLLLLVPIIIETKFVLGIWLEEIPEHTIGFVRIMLVVGIIGAMKDPTMAAIHATGNIKKTELAEMLCMVSLIPIVYLSLKIFHISPEKAMVLYLIVEIFTQLVRVWIIYPCIGLNRKLYVTKVIIPLLFSTLIPIIFSLIIKSQLPSSNINSVLILVLSEILTILSISIIGLSSEERLMVREKLIMFRKKLFNKH